MLTTFKKKKWGGGGEGKTLKGRMKKADQLRTLGAKE